MPDKAQTYNLTADGTAGPYLHPGGPLFVQAGGTWGGGSLAIKLNLGSGARTEYTMTADESRIFDFPSNGVVTFVLSGSSSPDLDIEVR